MDHMSQPDDWLSPTQVVHSPMQVLSPKDLRVGRAYIVHICNSVHQERTVYISVVELKRDHMEIQNEAMGREQLWYWDFGLVPYRDLMWNSRNYIREVHG